LSRDQKFFDLYSLVIGILAIVTLGLFVLAINMAGVQEDYKRGSAEYQARVKSYIEPFGDVYMPGDEQEAMAPKLEPASEPEPVAAAMTGPQVYNSACLACHGAGVGGAPVTGDAAAWASRIEQGIDTLYDHAINGFQGEAGYMPAKGGRVDLSDEEVRNAVDYMVAEAE
jgi:cytochrome c5